MGEGRTEGRAELVVLLMGGGRAEFGAELAEEGRRFWRERDRLSSSSYRRRHVRGMNRRFCRHIGIPIVVMS